MRLEFIGGCHVGGYPVGAQMGFPEISAQSLGLPRESIEIFVTQHVKIGKVSRIVEICRQIGERKPDCVVLQLGHLELCGGSAPRSTSASRSFERGATEAPISPFRTRWSTNIWRVRSWVKYCREVALRWRRVDYLNFERELQAFAEQMRSATDSPILLLSPLPCADPALRRYRRMALDIYRRCAEHHGLTYIDAFHLVPSMSLRFPYYDAIHLNADGHHVLGVLVARQMSVGLPQLVSQGTLSH